MIQWGRFADSGSPGGLRSRSTVAILEGCQILELDDVAVPQVSSWQENRRSLHRDISFDSSNVGRQHVQRMFSWPVPEASAKSSATTLERLAAELYPLLASHHQRHAE